MCNGVPGANCAGPSAGRQQMTPLCLGQGSGKHQQTVRFTCAGGLPMVKPLRRSQFCHLRGRTPCHLQTPPWGLQGRSSTWKREHSDCPVCLPLDSSLDIPVRAKPLYPLYWEQASSPAALPASPPPQVTYGTLSVSLTVSVS